LTPLREPADAEHDAGAEPAAAAGPGGAPVGRRGRSLAAHLERVLVRLSSSVAATHHPPAFREQVEATMRELDAMRARARTLRGAARLDAAARLAEMDQALSAQAVASMPADVVEALRREAREELAGYRERMPAAAYAEALDACVRRLAGERLTLPRLAFD
jgi:hypothetical protein